MHRTHSYGGDTESKQTSSKMFHRLPTPNEVRRRAAFLRKPGKHNFRLSPLWRSFQPYVRKVAFVNQPSTQFCQFSMFRIFPLFRCRSSLWVNSIRRVHLTSGGSDELDLKSSLPACIHATSCDRSCFFVEKRENGTTGICLVGRMWLAPGQRPGLQDDRPGSLRRSCPQGGGSIG